VVGPSIPRINSIRGDFLGGIQTRCHSFFSQTFSGTPTNDGYAEYGSEDDYNRRLLSRSRNNYYEKRPRSFSNGNVLLSSDGLS
jgi:restriction endonuclease S subunit